MTDEANLGAIGVERVPREDVENWTPIRIEGPLPLGVAAALMQGIGTIWPDAVIETGKYQGDYALNMKVPNKPPENLDEEFAETLRAGAEEDADGVEFLQFKDDGWVAFSPPEELCLHLGNMAHSIFLGMEGAINYVEWDVRTGDGPDDARYVLSIAASKEQRPGVLRDEALAEVERLRKMLTKNKIDPDTGKKVK